MQFRPITKVRGSLHDYYEGKDIFDTDNQMG